MIVQLQKYILAAGILISLGSTSFAQDAKTAEKLINEGVSCHDKGDYNCAIAKYDEALAADKNNVYAMSEKALTLFEQKKYDEVIKLCKKNISVNKGSKGLRAVYVYYGNALDVINEREQAINIYDEGIELFPDNYQMHYNKGLTLVNMKDYNGALKCMEDALQINPNHASSHSLMAWILNYNGKKIPAVMVYCRFLALEPESSRAKDNLIDLQKLLNGNVKKTGDNAVTIKIDAASLDSKAKTNDFSSVELLLSMSSAMDYSEKNAKKTPVELFADKISLLCSMLTDEKKEKRGFFWKYYAPYFAEMGKQKLTETYSYIAFASSEDPKITAWLKAHTAETDRFFKWSGAYDWYAAN